MTAEHDPHPIRRLEQFANELQRLVVAVWTSDGPPEVAHDIGPRLTAAWRDVRDHVATAAADLGCPLPTWQTRDELTALLSEFDAERERRATDWKQSLLAVAVELECGQVLNARTRHPIPRLDALRTAAADELRRVAGGDSPVRLPGANEAGWLAWAWEQWSEAPETFDAELAAVPDLREFLNSVSPEQFYPNTPVPPLVPLPAPPPPTPTPPVAVVPPATIEAAPPPPVSEPRKSGGIGMATLNQLKLVHGALGGNRPASPPPVTPPPKAPTKSPPRQPEPLPVAQVVPEPPSVVEVVPEPTVALGADANRPPQRESVPVAATLEEVQQVCQAGDYLRAGLLALSRQQFSGDTDPTIDALLVAHAACHNRPPPWPEWCFDPPAAHAVAVRAPESARLVYLAIECTADIDAVPAAVRDELLTAFNEFPSVRQWLVVAREVRQCGLWATIRAGNGADPKQVYDKARRDFVTHCDRARQRKDRAAYRHRQDQYLCRTPQVQRLQQLLTDKGPHPDAGQPQPELEQFLAQQPEAIVEVWEKSTKGTIKLAGADRAALTYQAGEFLGLACSAWAAAKAVLAPVRSQPDLARFRHQLDSHKKEAVDSTARSTGWWPLFERVIARNT